MGETIMNEGGAWARTDKVLDMTAVAEQRRVAFDQHHSYVHRRSIPAIYVIDTDMRILFSRRDPLERRREFRTTAGELPVTIAETVRQLAAARARMDPAPDTLASAPNASLVVRVIWMAGPANVMTVLVERLRVRDYLNAAKAKYGLSPREWEVLQLLLEGSRNAEIGARLHIAESTAIFHVKRLLGKMQARNRTELVSKILS